MDKLLDRVVPVIRETRIPTVVGLTWLLVIWLLVGKHVPTDQQIESGTTQAQIARVLEEVGPTGRLVLLTFAGYMLGSFLRFSVEKVFSFKIPTRNYTEEAEREIAEAQLLVEFSAPMLALLVTLAATWSAWWLVGLILTCGLTYQGILTYRSAIAAPERPEFGPDESRFPDRFARALELLSSSDQISRIGGIAELSQLARHSTDYRESILETLSAFVVDRCGHNGLYVAPPTSISPEMKRTPERDDLAALISIGKCSRQPREEHDLLRIDYCYLERVSLTGLDLRWIDLTNTSFHHCRLDKVNLSHSVGRAADFSHAIMIDSTLDGVAMSEAIMNNARLDRANCVGANFAAAKLNEATLCGANLESAVFNQAGLRGANMADSILINAHLPGAFLDGANLTNADLSGANLSGASILNAVTVGVIVDDATVLPRGYEYADGEIRPMTVIPD